MSKDRYAISSLNPHTHAGCDTVMGEDVSQRDCFNPHTHAGCDFTIVKISGILLVSIHTPTQGVTSFTAVTLQVGEVSIHTPTQGVTIDINATIHGGEFQSTHPRRVWHYPPTELTIITSFNPHTHAGCDIVWYSLLTRQKSFNPHTHAGCDSVLQIGYHLPVSFNPHTHAGCDRCVSRKCAMYCMFQSTHPRRVWHYPPTELTIITSFNPHTHAGCDN